MLGLTGSKATNPVIRWCQWIAALTGARISEIAEAHTADIYLMADMWVIKILLDDREEAASLKNETSHRIVPLHSVLICEGFLEYAESVRREHGEGPLFPQLNPNQDGRRGDPASRMISKWMRNKLEIKDRTTLKSNERAAPTMKSEPGSPMTLGAVGGRGQG